MEHKLLALPNTELKLISDTRPGAFAGYAAVFGNVDQIGDIIMPRAFDASLKSAARLPRIHYNHKLDPVIGLINVLQPDEKGLFMEGELTPGHSLAEDVYASMKHGAIDGLSIGYRVPPGGAVKEGKMRKLTNIMLGEVSVVTYPMNDAARIDAASIKSALLEMQTMSEVEDYLRDVGGFTKNAAMALISRVKSLSGDPETEVDEESAVKSKLADMVANVKSLTI